MSQVPAATRTLRVLRFLATQADPVPLERIMREVDLPRSTAYHLLNAMIAEGFVVHVADEHPCRLRLLTACSTRGSPGASSSTWPPSTATASASPPSRSAPA